MRTFTVTTGSDERRIEAEYWREEGSFIIFYRKEGGGTVQVAAFKTDTVAGVEVDER